MRDSLHIVERVEQRIDESGGHADELRELRLESIVVMLVLARGKFEVLLDL